MDADLDCGVQQALLAEVYIDPVLQPEGDDQVGVDLGAYRQIDVHIQAGGDIRTVGREFGGQVRAEGLVDGGGETGGERDASFGELQRGNAAALGLIFSAPLDSSMTPLRRTRPPVILWFR